MKINKIISVFAFFLILAVSSNMFAQEGQQKKMSPEQKAWMEYMMPGPMQKMLEKHVGKWKTVNKYWQYPGAEPMVSKGTAEYTMILGGRYLKGTFSGIMMNPVQKKEMTFRTTVKLVDPNTEVFNMYMMHDGKEFKGMEITYTRVK